MPGDAVWRALLLPFSHVRLVWQTPSTYWPAVTFFVLIIFAWWVQVTGRRQARALERLAFVVSAISILWFFQWGEPAWDQTADWQNGWTYYAALQQSALRGELPYDLHAPIQSTTHYFANLEAVVAPHAILLRWLSIDRFFMLHVLACVAVGVWGLVVLGRELPLSPLPWSAFLAVFLLNGHITAHLNAGHVQWVTYYLQPWFFVALVRVSRGDVSFRTASILALALATMVLLGGWHVFVWSWLFVAAFCLCRWATAGLLLRISLLVGLLAAVRLLPGVLTFGGGTNTSIGGFESLALVGRALVAGAGPRESGLPWWEYDTYVGYVGFLLLCIGLIPMAGRAPGSLSPRFIAASLTLFVLSFDRVYELTLFQLPGFVSERVATRFLIIPMLILTLLGLVRIDRAIDWNAGWRAWPNVACLLAGWLLVVQLAVRADAWRPAARTAVTALPIDVLGAAGPAGPYHWAVWLGGVVSLVAFAAVIIAASRIRKASAI